MARKKRGKRVAARQAQLSQRKKRGRGPSGIPIVTAAQRRRQAAPVQQPTAPGSTPAQAVAATAGASPSAQPMAAVSARQPLVYSYVGMELRRILMLSGVIIAVIVVLSIFLN